MKKIYLTLITLLSVFQFTYAQWTTSGTNIYNSNTGNVGIGTTTPGSSLQVAGDARFGTNGTYTDLRLFTDAVLTGYNQTNSFTPTVIPGSGTAYTAFHLKNAVSAGKNQMDLIVDGSIGVGITGRPAALIYAQGLTEQFRLGYDAADYNSFIVGSTGSLAITAHGTNPNITLAPGGMGNVGIGTTSPQSLLQVIGTATFAGNNANIDPTKPNTSLSFLANSGQVLLGWNRTSGHGETDLIANQAGGDVGGIAFYNHNNSNVETQLMWLRGDGTVGIGTATPVATLDVNGTGNFTGNLTTGIFANATNTFQEVLASYYYGVSGVSYPGQFRWYASPNNSLYKTGALYQLRAWDDGSNTENTIMTITGGGLVGVGTTHPQYPLDVYGIMHAQQVNVDMSGVPDYVFDKGYRLPTLTETAAYIDKNHHLSEIPSADEITKNGLNLGEMNKLLLKKVEELTLYLIEQNKKIEQQQQEINQLKIKK